MYSRKFLILGALLVSPAWSQEAPVETSALTPRTFDLSNDSIKQIVRNTAATQYSTVRVAADVPVKREPSATVRYVPPDVAAPVKRAPPRRPAAPARQSHSQEFLSTLFGIVIEEVLDLDEVQPDHSSQGLYNVSTGCLSVNDLLTVPDRFDACPAKWLKYEVD